MACHTGQEAVAGELVNCGANVNQPNHHGYTPLHLATVSSNGALCLELLINNGADVNVQVKINFMVLKQNGMNKNWYVGILGIGQMINNQSTCVF